MTLGTPPPRGFQTDLGSSKKNLNAIRAPFANWNPLLICLNLSLGTITQKSTLFLVFDLLRRYSIFSLINYSKLTFILQPKQWYQRENNDLGRSISLSPQSLLLVFKTREKKPPHPDIYLKQ